MTDMTGVLPDKVKEAVLAQIPLGKFGEGADIAAAVCLPRRAGSEMHHRTDADGRWRDGDVAVPRLGSARASRAVEAGLGLRPHGARRRPRREHRRAHMRTAEPFENLRPFGEAPNARARAQIRCARHSRFFRSLQARVTWSVRGSARLVIHQGADANSTESALKVRQ